MHAIQGKKGHHILAPFFVYLYRLDVYWNSFEVMCLNSKRFPLQVLCPCLFNTVHNNTERIQKQVVNRSKCCTSHRK